MEDSRAKEVANKVAPPSSAPDAPLPLPSGTEHAPHWREADRRRRWQGAGKTSPEQQAREEAFWRRYEALVRGSGVRPGVAARQ